jgi:O-methyltransferase
VEAPHFRSPFFWGVSNLDAFNKNIDGLVDAAEIKAGWFAGDNLITFARNLGFLNDTRLMNAWQAHAQTPAEIGILWRTATVVWAARQALRRTGDLIECGCYKGTTARILLDALDIGNREYWLYDLFEHDAAMPHHAMSEHSASLCEQVRSRFANFSNVQVIQGAVPDSFSKGLPDKICFAHIDMNNAAAEIGALDALESRFVPGAMIVLDDFGALPYRAQQMAETEWFAQRGVPVLELPTSQGLAIW